MTELEALAKDCIENHTHKLIDKPTKQDIYLREESIYISGYRECERRNKKDMENLATQSMILIQKNAELEETLRTYNGCGDWDNDFHTCRVYLQHEELQMYIHKLTKAKEIIKELLDFDFLPETEIKKQAERFLKEVSE